MVALEHVGAARRRSASSSSGSGAARRWRRRSASATGSGACWRRTRPAGAPPFTASHVRFAEALCAQVATAIGRAELFSRLETLAYQDPLTRLPNRRALDERLEEAVARARGASAASSRCCSATSTGSRTSTTATATTPATARWSPPARRSRRRRRRTPARSPAGSAATSSASCWRATAPTRRARSRATRRSGSPTAPGGPLTFSCGVACLDDEHRRAGDLFRAADAAQYAAKRVGGGKRVRGRARASRPRRPAPEPWSRRRFRDAGPRRARGARALRARRCSTASCAGRASWRGSRPSPARSPRRSTRRSWAISRRAPGAATVATLLGAERRDRYDPNAPDVRFSVAGRELRARRLPAHRGGDGARRRLRDRRADDERRTRASARCSPSGASRAVHGRRGARTATAPAGSSSCSRTGARTRLPAALPELRLLAGEAVGRAGAGYAAAVTSRREGLEDLHVAAQVRVRVHDRERPLLVDARAS